MLFSILVTATMASAITLTFDDISSAEIGTIPNGYGGFNWSEFGFIDGSTPSRAGSGYDNGSISGDYVAFNKWGDVATVSNTTFNFNGAYFVGAWEDGLNINISGFFNGNLKYQETLVVDTISPTWFQADYMEIDSLIFSSYGGTPHPRLGGFGDHFAMDNFTFNEVAPVPEPATVLLFGTGLAGIGFVVSCRKKRPTKK